ncbi:hypothetical protein BIW11_14264 [Tropilaelaps mercedesae]|uniref:C2H2-type domain-containing protein n=1 Tax=Tropilaelaps mercedesae TaxID=418985 RepID=A0A1V9WYN5_9ACAR|nr:hypothetical protein BIW11_14264 [Tropilaelaps mercedesae]
MAEPDVYVVLRKETAQDGQDASQAASGITVPLSNECSVFSCPTCGQQFARRPYLVRHIKTTHNQVVTPVKAKADLVGKCPYCSRRYPKRIDLLFHLAEDHEQDEVVIFNLTFDDSKSFTRWFEEVKMTYQTSFASHSAKVLRDGTRTKMYNCNRDSQANGRKTRKIFTRATSDYCTAHLFVRESPSGHISVLGSPTHLNHEVNASLVTKPNLPMAYTATGYRRILDEAKSANDQTVKFAEELGNMTSSTAGEATASTEAVVQRLEEQQRVYLSTVANLQVDSLVKDLNRIRFAFLETNSVRFEHFASVFRTLRATKLFQGFGNELSARVFIEDVFEVLLRELEDSDSFTNKAFIIYMLYATYFTQICRPRTPVDFLY